tara:strand:- start:42312 stop:42689 length:378 start_codon:yes stop_codon:yes gene_type:complete
MLSKYENVSKPSEFKNNTLRLFMGDDPEQSPEHNVKTGYLAIFDADKNYPTKEELNKLKQDCFEAYGFSHVSLNDQPFQTMGADTSKYDITIEIWAFESEEPDDTGKKDVELFHIIYLNGVSTLH